MPTIAAHEEVLHSFCDNGFRLLATFDSKRREMSEWLKEHVDHTACPSSPPRPRRNGALATAVMRELRIDANNFVM